MEGEQAVLRIEHQDREVLLAVVGQQSLAEGDRFLMACPSGAGAVAAARRGVRLDSPSAVLDRGAMPPGAH